MERVAHEGERGGFGVYGAHETQGDGVARGGIGGLYVRVVVEGEATALVEAYATYALLVCRGLGLEDDGLAVLLDEGLQGLGAVALRTEGGGDGKVLDVDEVLEVPRGEQPDGRTLG